MLLRELDRALAEDALNAGVLLVNDGSVEPAPEDLATGLALLREVEILHLRRNLGHQRAIAVGLAFIYDNRPCSAVVVMDGDGEDSPSDVPRLLGRSRAGAGKFVVFAKRRRRAEGRFFRLMYWVFRAAHRILTGRRVEVGNFSVVPWEQLSRLAAVSESWNHYAASIFKAGIPVELEPADRAARMAGRSKMDIVSLVTHGLSAMSVFADVIGVRLLIGAFVFAALSVAALVGVVGVKVFTDWAIPGWATAAAGLSLVIFLQVLGMSLFFVFVALHGRSGLTFLPIRDYGYFVHEITRVHPSK
jgi:hypothetical protein